MKPAKEILPHIQVCEAELAKKILPHIRVREAELAKEIAQRFPFIIVPYLWERVNNKMQESNVSKYKCRQLRGHGSRVILNGKNIKERRDDTDSPG